MNWPVQTRILPIKRRLFTLNASYWHRGGDEPLLGLTIPEQFWQVAGQFPEQEAVVSIHQNRRLTYKELGAAIDRLAKGLIAFGYRRGDRIGIWSTNNIEWLVLQMATARIGIILVTINPAYRKKELAYALQRSELQGLFVIPKFRTSDYLAMLVDLVPELRNRCSEGLANDQFPCLRHVVLYDPSDPDRSFRPYPGLTVWDDLTLKAADVSLAKLDEVTRSLDRDDPINIQYTSGTTGFPKAVLLSHHNLLNNAWFGARAMHLTNHDRLCVPVPFYHCFGMVLSNLLCLSVGATVVLPAEYFDPCATLEAIAGERCTAIHGVPTMFIAELEHPRFHEFNLTSLRTGIMAGATCPPSLMSRVIKDMHCPEILIGYGETEASPLTHLTSRDDSFQARVETVGRNLPHQEVKIVDTTSTETVPMNKPGEICFRGYHVMKGYYKDPEATREAIDENGWLHSGDLGVMDQEGYVRITGRLKEMIVRAGENIYPREVEDFLFTHPKVAEVAVFGLPDEYYGEVVMSWVKLHAGQTATAEEIREFCKGEIAHFKIPKFVWFVDEFPMTVTGKVQKFRMREITLEKMAEQPN
ncbi:MAG: AMP-binding protein [Deltaproteobacteria bacterium]|jgi:fatty-acyl-CoA synthase|nr:AMP-binding protein [Deltaproteobacteria bacterium]MBW2477692.1 AMP-binding protein [Deltaproteobacteria bacterium]